FDRDDLARSLVELGYVREDIAHDPGTFAVRGGIVDIFPAQDERAVRIELAGDEVESVRYVDPQSQRSTDDARGVLVVARAELPPTPEVRTRAAEAAERTAFLPETADKLA